MKKYPFDIALSFAGEDASTALNIYLALKLTKGDNSIFYYKKTLYTSGKLLKTELPELYKHKARFVVMLVSKSYINPDKVYAPIEATAIIERWKFDKSESFLIPIILDETCLSEVDDDMTKEMAYARWDGDPESLAEKIWELVRKNGLEQKGEKPRKKKKKGNASKRQNITFNNEGISGNINQSGTHIGDIINNS